MPTGTLKSLVIVSQGHPPLGRYLAEVFNAQGVKATVFCTDENTWFDKWVIHPVNKQLHNLRILPKGKNVWVNHRWAHRNYLEAKFQSILDQQQPDLILAIRGSTYCENAIKNASAVKFGWWVEPANRVHEIQSELPVFDWCYSMNEESLATFRANGYKTCSYMPHMFSSTEFFPIPGLKKSLDIVFVGNWNPRRQRFIDAALMLTDSVVLYGKDWLKKNWINPKYWRVWKGRLIQGQPLNHLYNRAKVVLNVTQWEPGADGRVSGMNMRFFEVPATKSLLMTDRVNEAGSIFKADIDFIDFGDVEDFKKKLQETLTNPRCREVVADHGYHTMQESNASYQTMVNDIVHRYAECQSSTVQSESK